LFFLVAWFVAAALSAPLVDSFVQVVSLIQAALLASLLVSLRIFAGRFMDALLAGVKAALFHSLIEIFIVRHIFSPFFMMVELRVMGLSGAARTPASGNNLYASEKMYKILVLTASLNRGLYKTVQQ